MSTPSVPLFVYGTLMVPEVLTAVIGRIPERHEAVLYGYRRYTIDGECYPAIVSDETSKVHGIVLLGLTQAELDALDSYEGSAYVRANVTLEVDGMPIPGHCYVWDNPSDMRLGDGDWRLEHFVANHLARYLEPLPGSGS